MDEAVNLLLGLLLVILFFGCCITGLIYGCVRYNTYSCYKTAEIYQVEAMYNWASGCFFKHKGHFIPRKEYEKLLIPNYQMGNAEVKVKIQD